MTTNSALQPSRNLYNELSPPTVDLSIHQLLNQPTVHTINQSINQSINQQLPHSNHQPSIPDLPISNLLKPKCNSPSSPSSPLPSWHPLSPPRSRDAPTARMPPTSALKARPSSAAIRSTPASTSSPLASSASISTVSCHSSIPDIVESNTNMVSSFSIVLAVLQGQCGGSQKLACCSSGDQVSLTPDSIYHVSPHSNIT
jgi:hypothetical protein